MKWSRDNERKRWNNTIRLNEYIIWKRMGNRFTDCKQCTFDAESKISDKNREK